MGRQREAHARHLQALQSQLATPPPTVAPAHLAMRRAASASSGSRLSLTQGGGSAAEHISPAAATNETDAAAGGHGSPPVSTLGVVPDAVPVGLPEATEGVHTPFGQHGARSSGGRVMGGALLTPGSSGGWPASNPLFESPGARPARQPMLPATLECRDASQCRFCNVLIIQRQP